MDNVNIINDKALYQYVLDISSREDDDLKQLRETTLGMDIPPMHVDQDAGQFLHFLIKLLGAKKILEIGTFTGYSCLWMAKALPEDGHIITCDIGEDWAKVGKMAWQIAGVNHKITSHIGPALKTLEQLQLNHEESFDLIFIDADKLNYEAYYEQSLPLVKAEGVIIIDNVLSFGPALVYRRDTPGAKAVDKFNHLLKKDERIELSTVTIGDGMTLIKKK